MPTGEPGVPRCAHCGRPIIEAAVISFGEAFHRECTHGPSYPSPFTMATTAPGLTETDIRRVVREELMANNGHQADQADQADHPANPGGANDPA